MALTKFLVGIVKVICVMCFLLLTISLILMILSRGVSFIKFDVMWTDEISRYLLVYLVLLGSGLGMIEGKHISVDYFLMKMPPKIRFIVQQINNIFTIIFCIIMIGGGAVLVMSTRTQAVATLRKYFFMPMAWWNSAIMIGGAIMLISVVASIYKAFQKKDIQETNNQEAGI